MTFRLAHITDLHLTGSNDDERVALEGVFTSLRDWKVDHVVVTGDVSHSGEAAAFRLFDEIRREYGYGPTRSTVLPGNHDYAGIRTFRARFGAAHVVSRSLAGGGVRLVGLDSTGPNAGIGPQVHHPAGWLEDWQLTSVRRILAQTQRSDAAVVLAVHHHVVELPPPGFIQRVGIPFGLWGPLNNADELLAIASKYGAGLILTGHDHTSQDRTIRKNGTTIRCLVGGATFDAAEGEVYSYRVFDFDDGKLVNEGWVGLCYSCWSTGQAECNTCDEDAKVECKECEGVGAGDCETCEGSGELECDDCEGHGIVQCGHCAGGGRAR